MNRQILSVTGLLLCVACAASPSSPSFDHLGAEELRAEAERVAHETIILDGHIDLPYRLRSNPEDVTVRTPGGDFDYPRAIEGGLDAPFMSIFVPAAAEAAGEAKQIADELIDLVEKIAADAPDKFEVATSTSDVHRLFGTGRIALLMGMENGSPIEGKLDNIDYFHGRGIRYITLCHSKDNHICDSSYDERHTHRGLTEFGRQMVRRMNDVGIMIDVSHISDDSFWQVMDLSQTPVIASHSSLRHFTPDFERNMSDDMVIALADRDGVVQINFGSSFIQEDFRRYGERRRAAITEFCTAQEVERDSEVARNFVKEYDLENPRVLADVTDVADHIDRVVDLVGVEHVGFGSDYDGVGPTLPTGLEDVSQFPTLIAELMRRGYTEAELKLIASGNVLRVFEAVEQYAAQQATN